MFFIRYWRRGRKNNLILVELDDLIILEGCSTDWAELLKKASQALEAGSMTTLKGAFLVIIAVVGLEANLARGTLAWN